MKRALLSVSLLFSSFFAACGDGPGKSWLVDHPRVLGARVEASTTTWLVAGGAPRIGWSFAACPAPPGNYAAPRCEENVFASGSGTSEGADSVAMATGALPAKTLVLAAFCEDSVATLEPRAFTATCASGAEAILASVVTGEPTNRLPSIPDDAIRFAEACNGPITFRFDEAMRDPGETLLLAHFVSGGTLDHTYSTFESSESTPKEVSIPWTPPDGARDVKVWFVLRDGRGGTAFVTKTICKD